MWESYLPPIAAITVIAIVLLRQWQKHRSYHQWLFVMRKCGRIPAIEDTGTGWNKVTCTNCYKVFLWYDADECICNRCGVHYWQTQEIPTKKK